MSICERKCGSAPARVSSSARAPRCAASQEQVQQVAATDSTVLLLGETGSGKEMFATQIHELSAPPRPPDGPGELRRDSGDADGKRAVRPRKRRLYRRAGAADRPLRDGRSLDDLPRRNRRPAARRPGQAAPRARGETDRTAGQPEADSRRHADHRRDPSRSRATDRGRHVSRRSVLPPLRVPDPRAAAARTRGRHPAARVAIRRGVLDRVRQAHRLDRQRRHGGAAAVLVAGQHPRAPQRRRAGDDRGDGAPADVRLPAASTASAKRSAKLVDVEREHIRTVLESTGWRVRGVGGAAERLGLRPTTLETRLAKLGLKRPRQA